MKQPDKPAPPDLELHPTIREGMTPELAAAIAVMQMDREESDATMRRIVALSGDERRSAITWEVAKLQASTEFVGRPELSQIATRLMLRGARFHAIVTMYADLIERLLEANEATR